MYYLRKYIEVIKIADKILEHKWKMDIDMERELRCWQCLALAREKDFRFEHEVVNIDGADLDFLFGFYYRRKRNFDQALNFLHRALEKSPNFNRANRELVNV